MADTFPTPGEPLTSAFAFRPRDESARDFINDCLEQAQRERGPHEPGWRENWSNYRVEPYGMGDLPSKRYPLAAGGVSELDISPINCLKTPESHQGVNALRGLLIASQFGVRDYIQCEPVGDEDIEAAKRVSRLIMYGLERPGNFRTNYETLGDGLVFGLGSYSGRWRRDIRLVPRRMPVPDPTGLSPDGLLRNPETGAIMSVLQNVRVPVFDDPVLEPDDLFDTWFDPSANRFDQLNYKIKRFRIRDEELEVLMDDPNWDADGIAEVLRHDPGERATGPDASSRPKLITEQLCEEDIKSIKEWGYYGGWMYEGKIPREVAEAIGGLDPDGNVIMRLIDGIVVQAIQSSQRSGLIHGGTLTILPTGRGMYGLSPLTVVRYLQDVSDTQLILTVQAMIESVYQNYIVGGGQGPTFARDLETRRPREVFPIQGEVDQIVPLPKDYAGLNIAVGALGLISQTMRNAMNARDPIQGQMRQTGEQSATEIQAVTTAAVSNVDQNLAVLLERDELPQMGRLVNDLYYINLDDEAKVFKRVGESETTAVSYFDIDATTDITFVGARLSLSKQQKSNQFRDFLQLMLSNPFTAASLDVHELARRYGDEALDVRGLERLMITDPEEIVARMQAMGLAQTVGPQVKGGGGPGGGAPPTKGRSSPGNGGGKGARTPAQGRGEAGG